MRLNHVTLIVAALDRSLAFYQALGLTPIVIEKPRYARLTLPAGDETLSIEVTGEVAQESRVQIYLECPDLDEVYERVRARGIAFDQAFEDMDYLWRETRLRDPDGHQIQLYFADDNHLDPP